MKFAQNEDGTFSLTLDKPELENHMRVFAVQSNKALRAEGVPAAAIEQVYQTYATINAATGIDGAPD